MSGGIDDASEPLKARIAELSAERDRYKAALEAIVAMPMVNGIPYCDSPLEGDMYRAAEKALEGQ